MHPARFLRTGTPGLVAALVVMALPHSAHAQLAAPAVSTAQPPLDCVIEPHVIVEVGSPVEGIIETIFVERSELVEENQVVAQLESRMERAAVDVTAARASMQSEVEQRKARLAFDERRRVRARDLFERSAISFDRKDESDTEAVLAGLELEQARESLRLARLEHRRALEALNRRTIASPIAGVVMERLMAPGERVDEEPILTVAQLDPLNVEVIVPASRYGSIRAGMNARVVPEDPASGEYLGVVTVVDRVIDAASGTFRVRAELPNPDYVLPGGLRCQVSFLPQAPDSLPASLAP